MDRLNILIIDRSKTNGEALKKLLETDDAIKEVKATEDLEDGLRMIQEFPVQIVLLDVAYPDMNGHSALKTILNSRVLPIIVLAEPSVDQTAKTVTAISNGAIDFIKKADGSNEDARLRFKEGLIKKMQHVSQANRLRSIARKVKENPLEEITEGRKESISIIEPSDIPANNKEVLVAIGTSTGGPRALHQVIQQIPKDFDAPILIVQHMPAGFTKSLAERLHHIGNLPVREAAHGEVIKKGVAYLAPGNFHMRVKRRGTELIIDLSQGYEHLPHRPSVDVMFESIATLHDHHKIAAVLTGMGRDGAKGVIEIKQNEKDAIILAESKETSVIDGMPQATFETDCVTQVLRIEEIGSAIAEYSRKG